MTPVALVAVAIFAVAALVDWRAVATGNIGLERVAKPAATAALVLAAALIDPSVGESTRWLFVAGLTLSLVGDVLLLPPRRFVPGLVAFLLGHVAFVVGFALLPASSAWAVVGALLAMAAVAGPGRRILREVRRGPRKSLLEPVGAYLLILVAMLVAAWRSGIAAMAVGATLFVVSDSILAWREFVAEKPWMRLAVTTTYHGALLFLVIGLVS